MGDTDAPVVFKKRTQSNLRKKPTFDDDDTTETTVTLTEKKQKENPLAHKMNREKKSLDTTFVSTKSAAPVGPEDGGATSINILAADEALALTEKLSGKPSSQSKSGTGGGLSTGPIKAPVFIRQTARFDYQPDICKDYKETGYCGFGDSCKFMHDRGDYKSGWVLEKEWDEEQRAKRLRANREDDEEEKGSDSDDEYPFACHLCRGPFKNPVITRCGHYFCDSCAIARYKVNTKCAVCDTQTQGIFNRGTKLIKRLEIRKAKQAALGGGDDDDNNEEGGENNENEEGDQGSGEVIDRVHAEGDEGDE